MQMKHRSIILAAALTILVVLAGLLYPLLPAQPMGEQVDAIETRQDDTLLFTQSVTHYPLEAYVVPPPQVGNESLPIGIAGETDRIHFGRIPVNASTKKFLSVNASTRSRLTLRAAGNISDALAFSRTVYVEGLDEIRIAFAPSSPGNYTGVLTVKSLVPKNGFGRAVLQVIP